MNINKNIRVDLPSFDIIFERFINKEWGSKKIRNPLDIAKKVCEFIAVTRDLRVTLTKE